MAFEVFFVFVDIVFAGIFFHKRLHGRHDYAGIIRNIGGTDVKFFVKVEYSHPSFKLPVKGFPVWMERVFQRLRRLPADCIRGNKSEDKRVFLIALSL
jgi:hypothetical protein